MNLFDRLLGRRKFPPNTDFGARPSYSNAVGSIDIEDLSCTAIVAINNSDFRHAEKLCRRLLHDFPEAFEGHECLAYLCASQSRHEEAKAHYEKALEKAREHAEQTGPSLIDRMTAAHNEMRKIFLKNSLEVQCRLLKAQSRIADMDRIEGEKLGFRKRAFPVVSVRAPDPFAGLPLGLSVRLLTSFGLPIPPKLADLRGGQMLWVTTLQESDSAIEEARVARKHAQKIVMECAVDAKRILMLRGRHIGSLDDEVADVFADYENRSLPVTIDEVVGIAVARIYNRLRREQPSHAGEECLRIVTRGCFALAETGNCAVDCVFDPSLRAALSLRACADGGILGDLKAVEKAYAEVSALDPEGGVVRSVLLKEPARLQLLPEHVLHSVVVVYFLGSTGHAIRIAALGDDGIWTMEGNYDGVLRVGRFVPFSKLSTNGRVLILHRRPLDRFGLFSEAPTELSTDTEVLVTLEGVMTEVNKTEFFKVDETRLRRFVDNPTNWRHLASPVHTLQVLRMRTVAAYDLVRPKDVAAAARFFGGHTVSEVVERWLAYAADNPSGLIIALGPAQIAKSVDSRSLLTGKAIREIGVVNDPKGRDYWPLDTVIETLLKIARENKDASEAGALFHGLTRQQFAEMNEGLKQKTFVLTPQRTDDGAPVIVERRWDLLEMKLLAERPGFLISAGDNVGEPVSIFDLLDSSLNGLVIAGLRIYLEPLVGPECEISLEEQDAIDGIGVWVDKPSEP